MLLIVRDKADLLGRLTAHRVRAPAETILWLVAPPPDKFTQHLYVDWAIIIPASPKERT